MFCGFPNQAQEVRFDQPVVRYGHNVLGETPEWGALCVDATCMTLPETRIFEDIAPRLTDLDFDGRPEIIVVETHIEKGASLAIYDLALEKITATEFIGTPHRWLAPIGAADWDNDGVMEIAYVEMPHLGKRLKIFSFEGGKLEYEFGAQPFSNHKIGETEFSSAVINCPEYKGFVVPIERPDGPLLFFSRWEGWEDDMPINVDLRSDQAWGGMISRCVLGDPLN